MVSRDEQTDILGGPILQRPAAGVLAMFSRHHFVFKSVTLLGLGLLVWIACARGLEHLKKHRELRYRKAMRRKHGIPDSDCRPFAVAYAAAKRALLEREVQNRKKTLNYALDHDLLAVDQRTNVQKGVRGLRRRAPETTVQLHDYQLPGKRTAVHDNWRHEAHSLDFADHYNPNPRRRVTIPEFLPIERPLALHASRKDPVISLDNEESRKRTFEDDESDVEHETIKKSRMDGDELVDGDERTDWYAQPSDRASLRASNEHLNRQSEGNYVHTNGPEYLDGLHAEDHEPVDEAMASIDEDEVAELKAVARGKKRDRAEAGSSFGGDDEEDGQNGRVSHHRKRRTMLRRRVELPARGQKRDREVESPESEGEEGGSETSQRRFRRSSKKRGRKVASAAVSEISVEAPRVSKDPLCGGRRVGDDWETDGVRYKVGDKGERLRLTLVRKARNKYHMPQDSQHPDRTAALEIYVETWMTEEQYKQAEGSGELAWQDASRESNGSKTPDIDSPSKNGKNLLWDSVKRSPVRRPFCQLMPTGASTRLDPSEQRQLQPAPGRRVASSSTIVSTVLPGVVNSPMRPGFRGFSKWEKQDREAEAMARIRAKIEEQKKGHRPTQQSAEVLGSATAPELGAKPLSVPTIVLTPAPAVAAQRELDDGALQSKTNTSTFSLTSPPSTSGPIKGTVTTATTASTAAPGFLLPSDSSASMSTPFPGALSAPTASSSTGPLPLISFTKPQQVASSTPTIAPSSTMPSNVGNGSVGVPSSPAHSLSTLDATSQPQPPSVANASKSTPFSFTKPSISSSTPSFGCTIPAVAKAETTVPPPTSTSPTTSESSKPTVPFFSFSGAPSSSSTATLPTSSAPSVPKFSFGQPSTTLSFAPGSDLVPGTAPLSKPTFKFGQAMNGTSTVPAMDESKKAAVPVAVFGDPTNSNDPVKPSSLETTSGSSTFSLPLAPAANPIGNPVVMDNATDPSTPAPANVTSLDTSSVLTGAPASYNAPAFSFGGTNTGSKSTEGCKPMSLFGGTAGGSNPVSTIGGNSTESKPTFTFGASTDGRQSTSVFGSNTDSSKPRFNVGNPAEGSKPVFAFGGSTPMPKSTSLFGGAAGGSKSTFAFNGTAENESTSSAATESRKSTSFFATASDNSKPSNTIDASKPATTPGSSAFGTVSMASPFMFGKKDNTAISSSTSTSAQTQPTPSFGAPFGVTGSTVGHPPTFVMSGDASQSIFGKPVNTTSGTFGLVGAGGSSSSSTFTFGKPAAQNQNQEQ